MFLREREQLWANAAGFNLRINSQKACNGANLRSFRLELFISLVAQRSRWFLFSLACIFLNGRLFLLFYRSFISS